MNESKHMASASRRCVQCGAELPGHLPPDLCPRCLLKTGLWGPEPGLRGETAVVHETPGPRPGELAPGSELGHYRLVRVLGGGGMGAVYEAEDVENGRRVALKILSQALDSPEARQRFFREGRLAASINHPNSVYIFGTEEIGGTPVIAMELVAGGTLEDRVRTRGPMASTEAVDAVLQIVAGLEAAQRTGILHRDVKPSNCFVDADGTVKIGDFGLSISTAVRAEPALTASGAFLGTPAFCSPEQLRGEELNARSDIYSVGATLFYLLTGRTPFEAKNVVALIATVLEQPALSPARYRQGIPKGLAEVVGRCLEKQADARFKTYDELRQALAPFGSAAPEPAALGMRLLAGVLDIFILGLCAMLVVLPGVGHPLDFLDLLAKGSWAAIAMAVGGVVGSLFYYALLEHYWGATVGKALCRLRVVGADRNAPRWGQAFGRALIYVVLPVLPAWAFYGGNPKGFYVNSSNLVQYLVSCSFYAMLAILFSTARRRNGFAAVHDRLTKTRVVSRMALPSRPTSPAMESPPLDVETKPMVGPYHVLETLAERAELKWLLGYDLRLLRKVWVRVLPTGTPPVPAALRNIGRPGRLRWLAGRRSADENWDAFEALSGSPLLHLIGERPAQTRHAGTDGSLRQDKRPGGNGQPWSRVRFWLLDLATELEAAGKDGSLPPVLSLDRVWITADGRAKLLDWPAPGLLPAEPGLPPAPDSKDQQRLFLGEVAAVTLAGDVDAAANPPGEVPVPLPLHVRELLNNLPGFSGPEAFLLALRPLLQRVALVTRWRRTALVVGCVAFPVFAAVAMIFGLTMMEGWVQQNPGVLELNQVLHTRSAQRFWAKQSHGPTDQQFAVYIAAHYRHAITNAATWHGALSLSLIKGESRRFAEQSIAQHPALVPDEVADADAAMKNYEPDVAWFQSARSVSFLLLAGSAMLALYVGLPAVLAALMFRGGLVLLIAGVTFVRKDGRLASRARMFWRSLVTWSPVGLVLVGSIINMEEKVARPGWVGFGLVFALTALSVALPGRGLADRLAGTWPVPR